MAAPSPSAAPSTTDAPSSSRGSAFRSGKKSADVIAVGADIGSLADIDQALDQAREHLGPLDLLHLNAGLPRPGLSTESTDEATFDALFYINVKGANRRCRNRRGR